MNYVLDASVALKWILPEADSDKAAGCGMILEIANASFVLVPPHEVERAATGPI